MFKLMSKKIITILRLNVLLNWPYVIMFEKNVIFAKLVEYFLKQFSYFCSEPELLTIALFFNVTFSCRSYSSVSCHLFPNALSNGFPLAFI